MKTRMMNMRDEIDQLRADKEQIQNTAAWQLHEIERLRTALKPFADLADKLEGRDNLVGLINPDDFRNAQAALKENET